MCTFILTCARVIFMTVSERLSSIRKSVSLTQSEFSEKVGVSRRAYVNYERGERELPSSFVVRLHDIFSINPTWLLTGEGAKTSELKNEMVSSAVFAVRSFAMMKKLEIDPEREARLVTLLVEYFEQGGDKDAAFVQKMLETGT